MPARDIYHEHVKEALVKDGWKITHDPLWLNLPPDDLYVDLGAERLVGAEKAGQRIAIEIKSFLSKSKIADLENAMGQYFLYENALDELESERVLYLAVSRTVYKNVFQQSLGRLFLKKRQVRLLVFNPRKKEIEQWIV